MKFLLVIYNGKTVEPELYYPNQMEDLFSKIVQLTNDKVKFAIWRLGECVGDFS